MDRRTCQTVKMHFKTTFKKLSFKITGSNATDMCREFGSLCAKKHFNILAVTDKVFSIQPINNNNNDRLTAFDPGQPG